MMEIETRAREVFGWNASEEFARELDQMKLVAEADAGGGYEWDIVMVFWHTGRKKYYYISGSGCSCNWISDEVTCLGDFYEAYTREGVLNYIRVNYTSESYGWTESMLNTLKAQVRDWRDN